MVKIIFWIITDRSFNKFIKISFSNKGGFNEY